MTDISLTLSKALASEVEQTGVAVAEVYYDQEGDTQWTNIVSNGALQSGTTVNPDGTVSLTIDLPNPMKGGKIYFLVQSLNGTNDHTNPDNIQNVITAQSNINWSTAYNDDFSFDSFEVTLSNGSNDVGNLTSVNSYGLPIGVSVPYTSQPTATVGYGISGTQLTDDIKNINTAETYLYNFNAGPLGTSDIFREAVSPTTSVAGNNAGITTPPFNNSDWNNFVQSLEGTLATNIVLSGVFVGTADAGGNYHNAGYYSYQLEWDNAGQVFWLDPVGNSQIKGDIQITPAQLEDSIYSTLGTVDIYTGGTLGSHGTLYAPQAGMNSGANNQWGAILSQLITGFSAGYYETSGAPLNPQLTGTVDLNQNINWDPTYAFGNDLAAGSQAVFYDHYSQVFFDTSNSYGSNYSDALMKEYAVGGPQISVFDPATTADVPTINLELYAPGDIPTGGTVAGVGTSQGYTPPAIYNYLPIPSGQTDGYAAPNTINSSNTIKFVFSTQSSTNAGVTLAQDDTVTVTYLKSDAGDVPQWGALTFDGATAGLWQNWNITQSGSTYIATAAGSSGQIGAMLLTGLPTVDPGASNTAVSWYQITVGGKTYNMYTTTGDDTTAGNGAFLDPQFAGQQSALGIDGLASIVPAAPPAGDPIPQYTNHLTVDFLTGNASSVDPTLLVSNTNSATVGQLQKATVPVAGIISAGTFEAFQGQTLDTAQTITNVPNADVVFAWTGENNATGAPTSSWISGYTNKTDGLDVARIRIAPTSGQGGTIIATGTADIDGQWQTSPIDINNAGTYDVTVQEFLPTDTAFATSLTPMSDILTLVVPENICFVAGTRIATPSGEVPVEQLAVGNLVLTASGAAQPVAWLGSGQVLATRGRRNAATPVIVRKDALADNVPHRDLHVTKGHSLFLDGALIPVEYLINHRSILWDDRAQEVSIYHVELASHDVLIADGAPAESYRDDGNRWLFQNANSGWDQSPKPSYAPVLTGGPLVDAVWQRLLERTGPRPVMVLTDEPDLHLMVDGQRLDPATHPGDVYVFELSARPQTVRITSRAAAPDELGVARDPRQLGVALRRIVLRQGTRFRTTRADTSVLKEGFHAFEKVNGLRWTNGDALLPAELFAGFKGHVEVVLHLGATTKYPTSGEQARAA